MNDHDLLKFDAQAAAKRARLTDKKARLFYVRGYNQCLREMLRQFNAYARTRHCVSTFDGRKHVTTTWPRETAKRKATS